MALISPIKTGDWDSVRQAISKLSSLKLGVKSVPTFAGLNVGNIFATGLSLSGLVASRLVYADANKSLNSVTDLTNWIKGTLGTLTVTDNGDGTVTLNSTASTGIEIVDVLPDPVEHELLILSTDDHLYIGQRY